MRRAVLVVAIISVFVVSGCSARTDQSVSSLETTSVEATSSDVGRDAAPDGRTIQAAVSDLVERAAAGDIVYFDSVMDDAYGASEMIDSVVAAPVLDEYEANMLETMSSNTARFAFGIPYSFGVDLERDENGWRVESVYRVR